jgi:excinuclease ABC subunit C
MIGSFLGQYYEQTPFLPDEILLPLKVDDAPLHEKHLSECQGKRVRILNPRRGDKTRMIAMAMENAGNQLNEVVTRTLSGVQLLSRLRHRLALMTLPNRIECFDNSNLYGTNPVSGMVVFEFGKPKKSDYRKYKIRSVAGPDDYAAMSEVLSRRFRQKEKSDPLPDLLMVDGGKGQLNIALSVLKSLGLYGILDVLGIAKKDPRKGELQDKIFLPERVNPVIFGKDADLLLFLQRIRDEAHRYAVSFHRQKHRAAVIRSELDIIPGIGKVRKQLLLNHFGSVKKIRSASVLEIAALPGFTATIANAVVEGLKKR